MPGSADLDEDDYRRQSQEPRPTTGRWAGVPTERASVTLNSLWEIVRRLVTDEGVTIFLTTQYLEEADRLADRIAVLHRGKPVAEGTPEELKRRVGGGHVTLRFADPGGYDHAARTLEVISRDDAALTLQIPGQGDVRSLRELLDRLDRASLAVDELQVHTPDLDDVFFALTGNAVAEQEPAR